MGSTSATYTFLESRLTVERLNSMADGPVEASLSPSAWLTVERSRTIVEHILRSGTPIYGATTGIGSQKDVAVGQERLATFSDRMIVSEATDFPGPAFAPRVVRAALIVLINNLSRGRSGVRRVVIERLLQLLAEERLPTVRQDTSYGSADLTPLSQLSLAILGRSLNREQPIFSDSLQLEPKESVSLIDNNSFALGHGALVLADIGSLLRAFDWAAATALEGLRGGMSPHFESAAGDIEEDGQRTSREHVFEALLGSALHSPGRARFLQDPLSFRAITQIHGAAYESWAWCKRHFEAEMNASVDNPLVDLECRRVLPSASMVSLLPTLSMDCLRQALAKVSIESMERAIKLQSPPFSSLPVGLAAEGAPDGGVLSINLNYIGAARMGSLMAAAAPVLLHYVGHMADGVEDASTLGPLSVSQTALVVERAWEAAALEMAIGVWAIQRRRIDARDLGEGVRAVYNAIRPLLPIGEEGTRVFDLSPIVSLVRQGGFL
jgi:histidine ammonia-lyase